MHDQIRGRSSFQLTTRQFVEGAHKIMCNLYKWQDKEDMQFLHNDLKGNQVLVEQTGKFWVMDFGASSIIYK